MQLGIVAAAVGYLALLFSGALLVQSYLVRGHLRDLRGDLQSLQTRLQHVDQRHDRMFEEVESLIGRIHASETRARMLTEQLMLLADFTQREQRLREPPEAPEAVEEPDLKSRGRTVYDHLMADDDPDAS